MVGRHGVWREARLLVLGDFERPGEQRWGHGASEGVSELVLDVGPQGFTGSGIATIERRCWYTNEYFSYQVPVSIAPDRTPPLLSASSLRAFDPYVVSWGGLYLGASELLYVEPYLADPTRLIALQSASDPTVFPTLIPLLDPVTPVVGLADPSLVTGSQQRLLLLIPLSDSEGNAALSQGEPVEFAPDLVVAPSVDFDTTGVDGAVGHFTYHAPGEAGSPCEQGGCLELGPLQPCHQHDGPTFLSLRFPGAGEQNLRIRLAFETSAEVVAGEPSYVSDATGYIRGGLNLGAPPLPTDGGPFAFSTGFVDVNVATQSRVPRGGAIVFSCDEYEDYEWARVIIERIELVAR